MTVDLKTIPQTSDQYELDEWRRKVLTNAADIQTQIDNLQSQLDAILALPTVFGTSPNTITLDEESGVRYAGTATVWEDLNFPIVNITKGTADDPTAVTVGDVIHYSFANGKLVSGAHEIPHAAKTSSTAQWHFHAFLEPTKSAGTTGATFTLDWEHRNNGTTTTGTVTGTVTSAQLTASSSGGKANVNMGSPISMEWGGQMTVKFTRTSGDAGGVCITTFGLHHEVDSDGSTDIFSKD